MKSSETVRHQTYVGQTRRRCKHGAGRQVAKDGAVVWCTVLVHARRVLDVLRHVLVAVARQVRVLGPACGFGAHDGEASVQTGVGLLVVVNGDFADRDLRG